MQALKIVAFFRFCILIKESLKLKKQKWQDAEQPVTPLKGNILVSLEGCQIIHIEILQWESVLNYSGCQLCFQGKWNVF